MENEVNSESEADSLQVSTDELKNAIRLARLKPNLDNPFEDTPHESTFKKYMYDECRHLQTKDNRKLPAVDARHTSFAK